MSFFSIKTVAQKQQNHIHKPLVGTVYLSENIIEPRKKKRFKSVSLETNRSTILKCLWRVDWQVLSNKCLDNKPVKRHFSYVVIAYSWFNKNLPRYVRSAGVRASVTLHSQDPPFHVTVILIDRSCALLWISGLALEESWLDGVWGRNEVCLREMPSDRWDGCDWQVYWVMWFSLSLP